MRFRFAIADVFTDRPYTGNQLAVFPRAEGIPEAAMQKIAREFNFAETTFVFPPSDAKHAARVRIFTPNKELPFAGHPTIGTAVVLAHLGLVKAKAFVLEEGVGPIAVEVSNDRASFAVEKPVEVPEVRASLSACAAALSLAPGDVADAWFASAGVPFCFVRLKDRKAVDRASLDRAAWSRGFARAWSPNLYLFTGDTELYVRMFAPAFGIEEDPATGSGAVALAGVLAGRAPQKDGSFAWRIDQGVAMGRPSRIDASAEKRDGRVARITIGGAAVVVAEGEMEVPTSLP